MKERIYVCHTYYHVYVTFLKELSLPPHRRGQATLLLSSLSNDFENLGERVRSTGIFEEVLPFHEKRDTFFPELAKYREEKGNIVFNMISRIRFTRRYALLEEAYIPVDFKKYKDIYVFCDSDPIGYYLNQKRIKYHGVEDGLNCIKNFDAARYENRGHFKLKAMLSKKWNLIFVQNGYGKYCIDMEVNDIASIPYPCPYYVEVPRIPLVERLTREDKDILLKAFVPNQEILLKQMEKANQEGKKVLILTEPLCPLEVREVLFGDLIREYEKEGQIFIKPHPRDVLNYSEKFPQYPIIDARVPMEILNFFPDFIFDKVVSVYTEMKDVRFGKEFVELGDDFMDKYEDPLLHRLNEQI